jgi:hypothetical protein
MRFIFLIAIAAPAWGAATNFSAGSWIIPMDVCYQNSQTFDGSNWSGVDPTSTVYASCPDVSTNSNHHDGILKAYGFVYRLLQHGVPVYYVLSPTKTSLDGTDFSITNNSNTPVARLRHSNFTTTEFMSNNHHTISYRGAPFIISAADVPTAKNLLKTNTDFTFTDSRTNRTVFQDVQIHVAKVNIIQAPVRTILSATPPKVALMDIGGAALNLLEGYLKDAGLYTATATQLYPLIGDLFTAFDNVSDFTTSDGLNAGGFKVLWAPHWNGGNNTATERDDIVAKIAAFLDGGGSVFAQCAAIGTLEGSEDPGTNDIDASGNGHFQVNASGNARGLAVNALPNPFPAGAGDLIVANPNTTIKAWLNPLTQTGDYPLEADAGGSVVDFTPGSGFAYRSFTKPLLQSSSSTSTYDGLQLFTTAYKDGNPTKGQVLYLGGHSYGTQSSSCGQTCTNFNQVNNLALERLILNSLILLGQPATAVERSRSAPIVYSDGKTYLGSFVQLTQAEPNYPPWFGHFREYPAGALAGKTVAAFGSVTSTWDSASNIEGQGATDSRVIFTAVPISGTLTSTAFNTGNLATLQTVSPTLTSGILTDIRKGSLGGIDHSIPAIIGPSQVAGSPSRATVAYVGALDGMLHAILVSGSANGASPGDELWAFIPPSQLDHTVQQAGGVDGSPAVGDVFIDNGGGTKQWKTILAATDGASADGTIDVIDITNPTIPIYKWTGSDTVTDGGGLTHVMGRASGAAIAPIMTGGNLTFAVFLATGNYTGTAGNGFNLYALDAGSGSVLWRYNYVYTNDTAHNDVHGTVAVTDAAGDGGPATKVYFGGLEGKVWVVDAATGANANILFDAANFYGAPLGSVDYPIESGVVLYRDPGNSHLSVLGVTGGADWVDPTVVSHVFKVDTVTSAATNLFDLAAGERVYAVPTIYGNAAYLITSKGNIQGAAGSDLTADGSILRLNLGSSGGVTTLASVKQGAGEVAIDSAGHVIAASAMGVTQTSNAGRDVSQATIALQNAAATQITVRAWLDLH